MRGSPPNFRHLSIREIFLTSTMVILITGVVYAGIIISDLYSSKKAIAEASLKNHLREATVEIDEVFFRAQQNVKILSVITPSLINLPQEKFLKNGKSIASKLISAYGVQYDAYWGFTGEFSRRYFKQPGMVFVVAKDPAHLGTPAFNDPSTFLSSTYPSSLYQSNEQEIWYHQVKGKTEVQYSPFYRDQTYTRKLMISLTQALYDEKGIWYGVAGVDITPEAFSERYNKIKIGKTGGVLVVDDAGYPIVPLLLKDLPLLNYRLPDNFKPEDLLETAGKVGQAFPLTQKISDYRGLDGEKYLVISAALKHRPWHIIAYQSRKEAFTQPLVHTLIIILMGICVFASLYYVARILGKTITHSVTNLVKNMDENTNRIRFLDREKKLSFVIPYGPKEFRRLGNQLNGIYSKLEDTVTDLTVALTKAEKATEAKTRFLSVMSHEIRTPLNSMLGLTDVLLLTTLDSEQHRFLLTLQRAGRSLLRILDDILDFSRLETGNLQIEPHEFDLYELMQSIEQLMRFNAESKGLQFNVILPNENYILYGDSVRIRQVLLNLIGNAIKFTHVGQIEVEIARNGQCFCFSVKDTGIGLNEEQKLKIFTHFSQGDASISRRFGGTGLGLSISKHIIELLGGTIHVTSIPNGGSTFFFEIALEIRRTSDADLPFEVKNLQPTRTNTPSLSHRTRNKNEKINILVVDDDEDNHRLLAAYLKFRTDIDLIHARSGKEAIALFDKKPIDLILMDLQMPDMDGLETIKVLRNLETEAGKKSTPIVVLSANTFPEDRADSLISGANDHTGKPIRLETFNDLIQKWT